MLPASWPIGPGTAPVCSTQADVQLVLLGLCLLLTLNQLLEAWHEQSAPHWATPDINIPLPRHELADAMPCTHGLCGALPAAVDNVKFLQANKCPWVNRKAAQIGECPTGHAAVAARGSRAATLPALVRSRSNRSAHFCYSSSRQLLPQFRCCPRPAVQQSPGAKLQHCRSTAHCLSVLTGSKRTCGGCQQRCGC